MSDLGERRLLHKGRRFDFEIVTHQGRGGRTLTREVVRHPGAVVIVPVLPDGRIVLIRNFRIAIGQYTLECPAGTLGKGEDPAACAARELIEETGYRAGAITGLGWFYTTPGLTDEKMHAFAATELTEVGQQLEEDEDIQLQPMPGAEVLAMIDRGDLHDAKSIIAVLRARSRGLLGPER